MRTPTTNTCWTANEEKQIEDIAMTSMERLAKQAGMYMSFEACVYATKLAIIQRQINDVENKLLELQEQDTKLLEGLNV